MRPGPARSVVPALLALLAALAGCGGDPPARPVPARGQLVEVARSDGLLWTGVAVSDRGRVFLCHPRWFGAHKHSVVELLRNGSFVPFPDPDSNAWRPGALMPSVADAWVCVQSVRCDGDDLWVLDAGSPAFRGILGAAAKLTRIDLRTNRVQRGYPFTRPAVTRDAYLNDLRVDRRHGVVFVTDSARGGIVVVDVATGAVRRVLGDHPSTQAEADVVPVIEGRRLHTVGTDGGETPLRVHVDGLAIDPTGTWLVWQALCGRTLWRAPTAVLADPTATAEAVAASVERVGPSVPADGLEFGPDGTLYVAAIEDGAVLARAADGTLATLVKDPRLAWPDSLCLDGEGTLWVTTSQIHRTPFAAGVTGLPRSPYLLLRAGTR